MIEVSTPVFQVEDNLAKQAAVMQVIEREQAAYKQAFGYAEWRAACEVGSQALANAQLEQTKYRGLDRAFGGVGWPMTCGGTTCDSPGIGHPGGGSQSQGMQEQLSAGIT